MATRLLLLASAALALNAWADYPERPVKIVVPFAAGSGSDTVGRAAAEALSRRMGVKVVVENMDGADGATGTAAVAKAKPDGYTLLATSNPFTITPYLQKKPAYHPIRDFVAVAQIAVVPLVVVTGAKSRFKTLDDLVAEMRQNPGKVRYATLGKGSLSHLEVALMNQRYKLQAQDQAHKSAEDALAATAGGKADFFLASLPSAVGQINKGALRALAVSTATRMDRLPGVPTLAEATKRPGYDTAVWYGLVAPARTPYPVLTRLEDEIGLELQDTGVDARIEAVGARAMFLRSAPFGGLIGYEYRKWGAVAAVRPAPRP